MGSRNGSIDPEMPVLERQDQPPEKPKKIKRKRKDSGQKSDQYEVECLLRKRWNCELQTYQYLVKWKDYQESESTWEDFERLDCPDLLRDFEGSQPLPLKINIERDKVRAETGFERGLWPKKIRAVAQNTLKIGQQGEDVFYMVDWDGERAPEYISSTDLVLRVPMMVLVALQSMVDYSNVKPNGTTEEVQQRNFMEASDQCHKLALAEAEKAKKMWNETIKFAEWKE